MTAKSSVTVVMTAKELGLFKKFIEFQQTAKKTETSVEGITKATKKLEREGVRTFERLKTPTEKFHRQLIAIRKAVASGNLSMEQGKTATRRLTDEYRNAGREGKKAFGSGALTNLKGIIAGYIGISAAIRAGTALLRERQRVARDAADKQKFAELGLSSLAQLSGGDEGKFKSLTGAARDLFKKGGARNLDEAARVIFSLESAGELDQKDLFADLFGIVADTAGFTKAAKTLKQAVGEKETGSVRDITSKAFAASSFSPATAPALLEAAAKAGGLAKLLGIRDESLLAATAITATASGEATLGGTQVSSLLTALVKKGGFKGLSLEESIRKVDAKGLSDTELVEFLGRKEALRAFTVLRDSLPELRKIIQAQDKAVETDLVGRIVGVRDRDESVDAARQARIAAAGEEESRQSLGIATNRVDAFIDREAKAARESGSGEASIAFQRGLIGFQRFVTGDEFQAAYTGAGDFSHRQDFFRQQERELDAQVRGVPLDQGVDLKTALDRNSAAVERQNQILESASGQGLALEVSER